MLTLLGVPPEEWKTEAVIVLDWYDGPREGFCSLLLPTVEFYFSLLAERATADGLDDRVFRISLLPAGTVASVGRLLAFAGPPAVPVWAPRWDGSVEETSNASQALDRLKETATATSLVVRSSDLVHFDGVWDVPESIEVSDWFAVLSAWSEANRRRS